VVRDPSRNFLFNHLGLNEDAKICQIRYRLTGMPLIVHACHCRSCQRETGTAHALNALYEADRVVHTAGEPEIGDPLQPSDSSRSQN
jgi:Glutathione-dependent formaldehyde-activating enzyme